MRGRLWEEKGSRPWGEEGSALARRSSSAPWMAMCGGKGTVRGQQGTGQGGARRSHSCKPDSEHWGKWGGVESRSAGGVTVEAAQGRRVLISRDGLQPGPIGQAPPTLTSHCRLPLGARSPKFSWQEGQKRLPLIGCVLLLIALVASLILLCEWTGGGACAVEGAVLWGCTMGGMWPWWGCWGTAGTRRPPLQMASDMVPQAL